MPLPGSEREPLPGARRVGPVDPTAPLEVSVLVRPRRGLQTQPETLPEPRLSREAYAAAFGADPASLAAVEAFAATHHLEVVESSPARRTVRLAGRAADLESAFAVGLDEYVAPDGSTFHSYTGPLRVPAGLADVVQAVFGLDSRPAARRSATHARFD